MFVWQRLQARRAGIKAPLVGSVTAVQLWGSFAPAHAALSLLLPDGVFTTAHDGSLQIHRLAAPEDGAGSGGDSASMLYSRAREVVSSVQFSYRARPAPTEQLHELKLAAGDYTVAVELGCRDGRIERYRRPLHVAQAGSAGDARIFLGGAGAVCSRAAER